jgi:hypothetical protein
MRHWSRMTQSGHGAFVFAVMHNGVLAGRL